MYRHFNWAEDEAAVGVAFEVEDGDEVEAVDIIPIKQQMCKVRLYAIQFRSMLASAQSFGRLVLPRFPNLLHFPCPLSDDIAKL
jgi:hypothetical protein